MVQDGTFVGNLLTWKKCTLNSAIGPSCCTFTIGHPTSIRLISSLGVTYELQWVKRYIENIGSVHGLYLHMIVMYGIVFGVNFLQWRFISVNITCLCPSVEGHCSLPCCNYLEENRNYNYPAVFTHLIEAKTIKIRSILMLFTTKISKKLLKGIIAMHSAFMLCWTAGQRRGKLNMQKSIVSYWNINRG